MTVNQLLDIKVNSEYWNWNRKEYDAEQRIKRPCPAKAGHGVYARPLGVTKKKNRTMTMQSGDILEIEEEKFALEGGIFEPFFKLHPDRRPKRNVISSNLWRKYIAFLNLENDELCVTKMIVPDSIINEMGNREKFTKIVDLSEIFLKEGENKLPFFDGLIILYYYPSSKYFRAQRRYFPLKFFTNEKPEKYKILEFCKGKLILSKTCNTEEIMAFKNRQFSEFKKSEEYSKMLNGKLEYYAKEENSERVFDRERFENRIFHHILNYTNKIL